MLLSQAPLGSLEVAPRTGVCRPAGSGLPLGPLSGQAGVPGTSCHSLDPILSWDTDQLWDKLKWDSGGLSWSLGSPASIGMQSDRPLTSSVSPS